MWYKWSLAWEGVSHVMNFDLALYLQGHSTKFWLGIQHDSIVWVIMRWYPQNAGVLVALVMIWLFSKAHWHNEGSKSILQFGCTELGLDANVQSMVCIWCVYLVCWMFDLCTFYKGYIGIMDIFASKILCLIRCLFQYLIRCLTVKSLSNLRAIE